MYTPFNLKLVHFEPVQGREMTHMGGPEHRYHTQGGSSAQN